MVSVFSSGAVERGFQPGRVQPKTIKSVFAAGLCIEGSLKEKYQRILNGAICLYRKTVVLVSLHYKDQINGVGLVHSGSHHHFIE